MKADMLVKDPVFQLNLLLWMAKEQPLQNYRVNPLFYNLKFSIIYIEESFKFPEEAVKLIQNSKLDISISPEPELVLGRMDDKKALYFEAKANSFGINSTNCKQARAHLVASGPAFGEVFKPLNSCLLCYVVPEGARSLMAECLDKLKIELNDKGLKSGPFSSHGLMIKEGKIDYSWDPVFGSHVGLRYDHITILNEIEEDTDPSPLILVFSDEDCSNDTLRDFYRQVVIEQVRACLLCDLHSNDIGQKYETTPDALLTKITDGIFEYLGRERQKRLRRLIRENVFKKIFEYWQGKQFGIGLTDNLLRISWDDVEEKEDFLDWIEDRRMRFDVSRPPEEPKTLFDM
jgi:hypothetical protein